MRFTHDYWATGDFWIGSQPPSKRWTRGFLGANAQLALAWVAMLLALS
jgi:hypothetical protein